MPDLVYVCVVVFGEELDELGVSLNDVAFAGVVRRDLIQLAVFVFSSPSLVEASFSFRSFALGRLRRARVMDESASAAKSAGAWIAFFKFETHSAFTVIFMCFFILH